MYHITDGESVAGTLRLLVSLGDVGIFGDLLYEGPTPSGLDGEEWVEKRALYLGDGQSAGSEAARRRLRSYESSLISAAMHEEIVLWLDHRLTNQLILIRLLDHFSHERGLRPKLCLISINRFPGVAKFVGLGQLNQIQLESLVGGRVAVSAEQFQLGRAAWAAFRSPTPSEVERVISEGTATLPYLAAALHRHLEQFPSVENGLSRTERQALTILRDRGPQRANQLFASVQAMEAPLYMGDLSFFRILGELGGAQHSLVQTTKEGHQALSEMGQAVLEGKADHVKLNGIDRWLGGTHLRGSDAAWRWDASQDRLKAA